jgi:hypothetical protein
MILWAYKGVLQGTGASTNCYKLLFFTGSININKAVSGTNSNLATVGFSMTLNQPYWFRLIIVASTIYARVWQDGSTEPTGWTLTATDTSVTGTGGAALLVNTNAASSGISVDSFQAQEYQDGVYSTATFTDTTSSSGGTNTGTDTLTNTSTGSGANGTGTGTDVLTLADGTSGEQGTNTGTDTLTFDDSGSFVSAGSNAPVSGTSIDVITAEGQETGTNTGTDTLAGSDSGAGAGINTGQDVLTISDITSFTSQDTLTIGTSQETITAEGSEQGTNTGQDLLTASDDSSSETGTNTGTDTLVSSDSGSQVFSSPSIPTFPYGTLAVDDFFDHANQAGWPAATDAQTWAVLSGATTLSINGGEGQATGVTGLTFLQLGSNNSADQEVLVRLSVSSLNYTAAGIALRITGSTTAYRIRLNSATPSQGLGIVKTVSAQLLISPRQVLPSRSTRFTICKRKSSVPPFGPGPGPMAASRGPG